MNSIVAWFYQIFRCLSHFKYNTLIIEVILLREVHQIKIFLRLPVSLIFFSRRQNIFWNKISSTSKYCLRVLCDLILNEQNQNKSPFPYFFFQTGLSQWLAYQNISTHILILPAIYYFNLLYRQQSNTQLE